MVFGFHITFSHSVVRSDRTRSTLPRWPVSWDVRPRALVGRAEARAVRIVCLLTKRSFLFLTINRWMRCRAPTRHRSPRWCRRRRSHAHISTHAARADTSNSAQWADCSRTCVAPEPKPLAPAACRKPKARPHRVALTLQAPTAQPPPNRIHSHLAPERGPSLKPGMSAPARSRDKPGTYTQAVGEHSRSTWDPLRVPQRMRALHVPTSCMTCLTPMMTPSQ